MQYCVKAPVTAPKGPPVWRYSVAGIGLLQIIRLLWVDPQQEQLPMMLGLACRADLIGCVMEGEGMSGPGKGSPAPHLLVG